ncbi:MAG: leucine-rich repeat domain-containing protein [Flavobacteriaceae bacterium]|nr:leucine-rich repeat domain-containing protein [Flavobacteriaceae bacterium]
MSLKIALKRIEEERLNPTDELYLTDLELIEIPVEVSNLRNLEALYLNGNQITEIKNLEQLKNLQILHLGNNQISEIKNLEQLKELLRLRLDSNQISEIKNLEQLKELQILHLGNNQISEIKNLEQLKKIQSLQLSRNKIIEIKNIEPLKKLQRLQLGSNQISEIKNLEQLKKLQSLDLTNNLITILGKSILDLDLTILLDDYDDFINSLGIFVQGNPILTPPPEVNKQGNKAIAAFFESTKREKDIRPLNEVKVILVGEGASGKTSLVKCLLGDDFDIKEKQTHGINISKRGFQVKQENLTINFWDFGGQEIVHATHQFFLTKRCLYILVLDSRKDEKAEYWLKYIESFGGNAPIFVILNKMDENPSFELDRKFLSEKYPSIQDYFKISCKEDRGIDTLRSKLVSSLWDMELRNTPFHKNWFQVKEHFHEMTDNYIAYTEYKKVCESFHVTDLDAQSTLLGFLNDLGIVLNYEKLRLLNTQVLNPLWLTKAVYRVINSPMVVEQNGRFALNDLSKIINDVRFNEIYEDEEAFDVPEDKFLFIIGMMKEFQLIYEVERDQYVAPELLPTEQTDFDFLPNEPIIKFIIEYSDFLPSPIISRLMVKMHPYIYNNQIWKKGMLLQEKLIFNSMAKIVLDKEKKQITLEVGGDRRHDFLTVLRQAIREVNESYEDLDYTEWIPLPELHKGLQLLVDYQEILGHDSMGSTHYTSGKLKEKFLVHELLNGVERPETRKEGKPIHIFVSYSSEDKDYKDELIKHLMSLVRLKKVYIWHDKNIDAGDEWENEVFENLDRADIVLCLISSSFIASDFCYKKELTTALEAHDARKKVVIPLRIRKCSGKDLPINKLQGIPKNWLKGVKDDLGWTKIVEGIEDKIDEIQKRKTKYRHN